MNEKFNKNATVEQLTNMFLSHEEEKGLIVKDPSLMVGTPSVLGPELASRATEHSLLWRMSLYINCDILLISPYMFV